MLLGNSRFPVGRRPRGDDARHVGGCWRAAGVGAMGAAMRLHLFNVQCRLAWWLEDAACWLVRKSNQVYNYGHDAPFPPELVHDAFSQKLRAYLDENYAEQEGSHEDDEF